MGGVWRRIWILELEDEHSMETPRKATNQLTASFCRRTEVHNTCLNPEIPCTICLRQVVRYEATKDQPNHGVKVPSKRSEGVNTTWRWTTSIG